MVKIEDLKRINLLRDIPDHLLEILAREAQLNIYGTGTQLMTINEKVDTFFMLIMGQVALKKELTSHIDVIFDYVQSGSSFGASALMEGSIAFHNAVCQEPCEAITISGKRIRELFDQNHELAFYILQGAARQYKKKMDIRTKMIIKTLDENPELKKDIHDIETLTPVA
ncbi:MAG: cyclic nucleotide-binding domain-containing protein [Desulfobacula sp.]|nr:cyclic nucleotide-binding domain-containing protein [Desulfobacula sp.]MDA8135177.1 cyclic nucleotide-binding domain-containing protein [Desulfobacteraceae bacterium]